MEVVVKVVLVTVVVFNVRSVIAVVIEVDVEVVLTVEVVIYAEGEVVVILVAADVVWKNWFFNTRMRKVKNYPSSSKV